jgi:hypothetical protein
MKLTSFLMVVMRVKVDAHLKALLLLEPTGQVLQSIRAVFLHFKCVEAMQLLWGAIPSPYNVFLQSKRKI